MFALPPLLGRVWWCDSPPSEFDGLCMHIILAHECDGMIDGFVNETLFFQLIVGLQTIAKDSCPWLDVLLDQRDQGGGCAISNAHQ